MYENLGGPRPPAADAHAYEYIVRLVVTGGSFTLKLKSPFAVSWSCYLDK